MNGFKHGVAAAHVGASGGSDAALNLGRLVSDNISVQIRQDHNVEIAVDLIVYQVRRHDIHVPVVGLDFRIILGHVVTEAEEFSVCLFHNIRLGYNGNVLISVCFGVFKRRAGKAGGSQSCGDFKVDGNVVVNVHAPASQSVFALSVFTVEDPVDVLFRNDHRTHVSEEIQLSSQCNVGAFNVRQIIAFSRSGGRSLEEDVAFFDCCQHIRGNRFHFGDTVLQCQTGDFPDFDFSRCQLVRQQLFQDFAAGIHNDGADAVAVNGSDDDFIQFAVVGQLGGFRETLYTRELILYDCFKCFHIAHS